jgi:hypothetical protein
MTVTLRLLERTDVDFADPRPASDFAKRVKNFDDVLSNPLLSIKLSAVMPEGEKYWGCQ